MIGIVNIDPNPRESGEHLYEVRVNRDVLFQFSHNREEPLSRLLYKASAAAFGREKDIEASKRRWGKR